MISLIPSPTLPLLLAKGHPGAQYRDNATAQGLSEEEAFKAGMDEKSKGFAEAGSEVHVPD